MRVGKKLNKYERKEAQAKKVKNAMSGTGVYIFENNSDSDLKLPKPTESGQVMVGPRRRFEGDSYFLGWVGHPMNMLRLIDTVDPTLSRQEIDAQIKENAMIENKLILDQPDTITQNGKIEYIAPKKTQPLNDNTSNAPSPDVLLTESPLDGVEIILGG